ncbi:MAG: class I SAM-dependent methyltransferase [Bacteroidales bacterium]|nr:class I SAM-dependent methyltransferase [Bacteroidales bacterium]
MYSRHSNYFTILALSFNNPMHDQLTGKQYWENYWKSVQLPLEIRRENAAPNIQAELDVFEKYLPKLPLSVLEIGGAPGQYLAWFHKTLGYEVSCLDYSDEGCKKTRENFKLLNIRGKVYQGDLFSDTIQLPRFDVVCSFGFIEHFSDLNGVVGKHLEFLKPGGILLLGVPNLLGINHWFLKRLAPDLLKGHNLKTMNASNWHSFEMEFRLEILYKDYVGGFEPSVFLKQEKKSPLNNILFFTARVLNRIFHNHLRLLRKYNSKKTSGYLMGIYRKPEM